jgi:hypothetical protein
MKGPAPGRDSRGVTAWSCRRPSPQRPAVGRSPTSTHQELSMNASLKTLLCTCIAFAAHAGFAQDAMKKDDAMAKKEMTLKECKDHMAMAKKDGMKKDDAAMKKDAMCHDMMKKTDGMSADPMKK